jgi:hypothetical protein
MNIHQADPKGDEEKASRFLEFVNNLVWFNAYTSRKVQSIVPGVPQNVCFRLASLSSEKV